jgi:hypothetical protein
MFIVAVTAKAKAIPLANAAIKRLEEDWRAYAVAIADPAPIKTKRNVPTNSATAL